uniref:Uncharacterized protein n=1 Tax=Anguilla anguilla TaxID=7936 RepID=A0A0E9U499_ANGAN
MGSNVASLHFLGLETLLVLVQPPAKSTGFLGLRSRGLYFLPL